MPRDLVAQLTEDQVVRPGTRGGERGRIQSVTTRSLKVRAVHVETAPLWLSEEAERRALLELPLRPRDRFMVDLLELPLRPRDRFMVDLLYFTGLRVGELLSLFRQDQHLLADNSAHGCRLRGPHLHVVRNRSVNGARAKSLRTVPVPAELALSNQEALSERLMRLGDDGSPNAIVALAPSPSRAGTSSPASS